MPCEAKELKKKKILKSSNLTPYYDGCCESYTWDVLGRQNEYFVTLKSFS